MGDTIEQWKGTLEDFWKTLSNFMEEIKKAFENLFWKKQKEEKDVISDSQKKIDDLAVTIMNQNLENLKNLRIWEEEKKVMDKILELDNSDKNIESWFGWLQGVDDSLISWEKEFIILLLREFANNDNDANKTDLIEKEFKKISNYIKEKKKLCEKVFEDVKASGKTIEDNELKEKILIVCNENILGINFKDEKHIDDDEMKKMLDLLNSENLNIYNDENVKKIVDKIVGENENGEE